MQRLLGHVKGLNPGPCIIITAAIHGNEGAGVEALRQVLHQIEKNVTGINGEVIGLIGNVQAYQQNVRFIKADLNRIWSKKSAEQIELGEIHLGNTEDEYLEQVEIYQYVKSIFASSEGPFIFIDLHSVSSQTVPFITINDTTRNRRLSKKFSVPIILGLEEHIKGSFLNRVNALGHTAIGFEGGQHTDIQTTNNHVAFLSLLLHETDVYRFNHEEAEGFQNQLASELAGQFFEIRFRQVLKEDQVFKMKPNFKNFTKVRQLQVVANLDGTSLSVPFKGRLFMPLYQAQGDDGFFMLRRVFVWILKVSDFLRMIPWNGFLVLLPGVKKSTEKPHLLLVNQKTARFMTVPIFHLLGYQCIHQENNTLHFIQRERAPIT